MVPGDARADQLVFLLCGGLLSRLYDVERRLHLLNRGTSQRTAAKGDGLLMSDLADLANHGRSGFLGFFVRNVQPTAVRSDGPHGVVSLDAKALRRMEQRLKRRDVAAFVIEPIRINLGILIPDHDVIRRVRELCRRYGTLFSADEVASGFGRTGRMFACEPFDSTPTCCAWQKR